MAVRWRILLLLFFARVGLGLQFQTLGSVSNNLIEVFGLDYTEIGTLIGLFMLPGLFLAIPAGLSGRYFSDRVLGGGGLILLALGGLLSGLAQDSMFVGLGRLVSGAGFLFSTLYFTKMTADWFAGKEIATAMSILVMSWPFGIAIGQIGHEWLAETVGWRWAFLTASSYCAIGGLTVLSLYRPPVEASVTRRDQPAIGLSRQELGLTLIAAAAWGLFNAAYVIYLSFSPLVLEERGVGTVVAATIISVGSWVMIISGAACGQLADRSGRPGIVLTICMIGAMAALLLLGSEGNALVSSLLFGLVGMAPAGIIMALAGEAMRPDRRAFGMGIFFTGYYAIMTVGPPIAGWIYDRSGNVFDPIILSIVLFGSVILANGMFRLMKRHEKMVRV
ncbi:MAG: MFS transporter [Sneathiella sp.]|uniref:MFS transporter n=1 Tax=Sneathiella sp. TaxID=1964365 RepID=UPI000C434C9B|nr:MFS transporter [Sneathiella sp.]MAZ01670.1 MFS transporter [Sneathiella sp.]